MLERLVGLGTRYFFLGGCGGFWAFVVEDFSEVLDECRRFMMVVRSCEVCSFVDELVNGHGDFIVSRKE